MTREIQITKTEIPKGEAFCTTGKRGRVRGRAAAAACAGDLGDGREAPSECGVRTKLVLPPAECGVWEARGGCRGSCVGCRGKNTEAVCGGGGCVFEAERWVNGGVAV